MTDYINPGETYWPVTYTYWPTPYFYWPLSSDIPPIIDECFITIPPQGGIASYYFCLLRDVDGNLVALFDDWIGLSYREVIREISEGTFVLNGNDSRTLLFSEDCRLEIYRSVPGAGLYWYKIITLLVDGIAYTVNENNERQFIAELVGLNDFPRRREVAYKTGTIHADKEGPADTVLKDYVLGNLGNTAIVANGRFIDGTMPNFSVAGDTGIGKLWKGSAAGQNLLTVIQDISKYADIDFQVIALGDDSWRLQIYPNKMGSDRTNNGLNASSGKNSANNTPVYFSIPFGTVSAQNYRKSRRSEANTIIVWGKGDRSTQKVIVRSNTQRTATKYNKRELSISGSVEYEFQMNAIGDQELEINKVEETFDVTPLQQVSQLFGKHYFLGDRLMVIDERTQQIYVKRIMAYSLSLDGSSKQENITFEFE